ncbi:histidine phosphatase family protein [Bacillus sp. X2(2017)]|uniref:histidine phosphatase family protein n=1 Tax=Bacillus sp. X2(2017) TaxID=2025586 RepID=UPI000BA877CC|nr:histidine phosphatase family protein [Bacillus sp. X2(2017)]PAO67508.1 hypothetical protein CIK44_17090 [Bacillus sp. X2(2017)]
MVDFSGRDIDKNQLLETLKKGGYVLYFRHADPAETSGDPGLSNEGIKKSELLKSLFVREKINVLSPVWVSPAKRTKQTAEVIFGTEKIQIDTALYNMDVILKNNPVGDEKDTKVRLIKMLETIPNSEMNTVIIGHHFTFGIENIRIPYLGVVVIRPMGIGKGYEVIANLEL